MLGNVVEWVQDCYHDSYDDAPEDSRAWEVADGSACKYRVPRGGSWFNEPRDVRSAGRGRIMPDYRTYDVGFRLAQDLD